MQTLNGCCSPDDPRRRLHARLEPDGQHAGPGAHRRICARARAFVHRGRFAERRACCPSTWRKCTSTCCASRGTNRSWVRRERADCACARAWTSAPWKVGGTGVQTYLPNAARCRCRRGSRPVRSTATASRASMRRSTFCSETGVETIHAHEMALLRRFVAGVKNIPGVTLYGDFDHERTAVATLNIERHGLGRGRGHSGRGLRHRDTPGRALRAAAAPRRSAHEEQGAVRFSFGWYNTEEEADAAVQRHSARSRHEREKAMARHHLPHDGRGDRDGKALPGEGPARAAHPRTA